jgi:ABC-2 type transport system ATP-binding protein
MDAHLFRVQFDAHPESVDALVAQCVARNWGLYQLAPAQSSLEDVFVNLTRKEETTSEAAA